MAKIETITELLVDEITHFESEIKKLEVLISVLKTNKIKIDLDSYKLLKKEHLNDIVQEREKLNIISDKFMIEMKKQSKKMLFYTVFMSLLTLLLTMLIIFKIRMY